ncbi:LysR family transcriptional regulator [Propionivibrio limicola]|uniref:LysR family transcriptional regulator n=1 Tax=Propionivibrio limicola TaxID=167645 RepID=UPI0012920E51|nr:LysR family transcriptional regulator [Propionivibrio limicola]
MDIRSVDLNLLKAFDALMDERSVTRAAARLSLTQPAVSGMLNRLRDCFGDPLFTRTSRGVTPTPRAEELSGGIKRVLAEIDAMLRPTAFDPATAGFTVSIAATDYALRAVLVPFIAALRPLAPGIRIAVRQINESLVQTQLERGDLDLALLTPETAPPDLHARVLFDETYVCALREGHPDSVTGALTLERFCALDHVMVSLVGGGFRSATDEALERIGGRRRVVLSVPSFVMLLDILRTSDLIALVPRRLVAESQGLTLKTPPLNVPGFTKIATWHARTHEDPGHRWVRSLLFKTCGISG